VIPIVAIVCGERRSEDVLSRALLDAARGADLLVVGSRGVTGLRD
jgi:nucleotide-binding universal stress UspA family protein